MEPLYLFSASSANEEAYMHLRLVGASLFIPQLNALLESHSDYNFNIIDIKEFGYMGTGRKYGVSDVSIRKWLKKYTT